MTKKPLYARVSTAALIGASLLPWIDTAQAQHRSFETPHALDGIYAVEITTRQGDCDSAYHWSIAVSGGHVSSAGDTPMEASGRINRQNRACDRKARGRFGRGHLVISVPAVRWFLARHPA
jgi:hypothetical protein